LLKEKYSYFDDVVSMHKFNVVEHKVRFREE